MSGTSQPWMSLPAGSDPTDAYEISVGAYWRHVWTRNRRRVFVALLAIAAIALVPLLAACDASPGSVTSKYTVKPGGHSQYFVRVKHDGKPGITTETVPQVVYLKCSVGDRWPDCAK